MNILECTNLDMGTSEPLFNGGGGYSIQTDNATGTYSFKANKVGGGVAWLLWGKNNLEGSNSGGGGSFLASPTMYAKTNIYIETAPTSGREQIGCSAEGGGSPKLQFMLNSSRQIEVYDRAGVLKGTSAVLPLATGIELQFYSDKGTNAPWELYINGALALSGTCDQYNVNNAFFIFGSFINQSSQNMVVYYRDIFISDELIPHGLYIKLSKPISNGSTHQWINGSGASDYTQVREIPQDGNTTYIQSPTTGNQVSLFRMESRATLGITDDVIAVKPMVCKRGATGTANQSVRVRSGGTNIDTALEFVDTNYRYRGLVVHDDPSTSTTWTNSAIDLVEVGVVEQASGALSICTQVMALFLCFPALISGGNGIFGSGIYPDFGE